MDNRNIFIILFHNILSFFNSIRWEVYIRYLELKWIFRINLGDKVYYNGNVHTVCNGVRCNSWRLDNLANGDDGWVQRKSCKKVITWKNFKHSYKSGFFFYKTSWLDIWKREGIKNWMRGCNIW